MDCGAHASVSNADPPGAFGTLIPSAGAVEGVKGPSRAQRSKRQQCLGALQLWELKERGLHLVIENCEAIDGRCFGAQDKSAKGDGQGDVTLNCLCFVRRKIALGADPDTNRPRPPAAL